MKEQKFYVYGIFKRLKNEKLDECFYIGKGCSNRLNIHLRESHLKRCDNEEKKCKIESSQCVYSKKIIGGLNEELAYKLEEKLISEVGLKNLTNKHSGGKGPPRMGGKDHPLYGKERSEEVKKKVRKKNTGENHHYYNVTGDDHPQYGRKLKSKTKEKIKKASRGRNSKYSKKKVASIKWLLKNTDANFSEISQEIDVPKHLVGDIKDEHSWKYVKVSDIDFDKTSLIKFKKKKEAEEKRKDNKLREIKWYAKNTKKSYCDIGKKYGKSASMVSSIVNGFDCYNEDLVPKKPTSLPKNLKVYSEREINRNEKLTEREVSRIKFLLLNKNTTNKKIAREFDISPSLVSKIKNEKRWGGTKIKCKLL